MNSYTKVENKSCENNSCGGGDNILKDIIFSVLKSNKNFVNEQNELLVENIVSKENKHKLIELLLSNEQTKQAFFEKINDVNIFKEDEFLFYVKTKDYLENSYTAFDNKIGFSNQKQLDENVVLNFPYKDCVLEGGQSKDDETRKEIFFNEILAKDEIERLIEPKVLTNFEKYTINGKEDFQNFTRDAEINKKRGLSEDTITDNLLIKGNNLLVLHSLVEEFRGKVKLIYIDPPYNTGNDSFNYNDKFNHSTWLCFMKNRLEIARELLSDDGVIFIQCDDNEQAYLKVLMDEIFRKENFIACCPRKTRSSATTKSDAEIQKLNDYLLIYWKNKDISKFNLKNIGEKTYPYNDERGKFFIVPLQDNGPHGTRTARPNLYYPIYQNPVDNKLSLDKLNENCITLLPSKHKNDDGCWMWSIKKFNTDKEDLFVKDNKVYIKHYYNEDEDQNKYQREKSWLDECLNLKGTIALNECFEEKGIFNNPKPEELLEWVINLGSKEHDIILDFFSGSGTTGAVAHKMNRRWIMVEQMDYIETITKERIKKVIEGEQGGISKSVNWQGGGEFVYFELKKYNENFVDMLNKAETKEEVINIFQEICKKGFVKYNVDIKALNEDINKSDSIFLSNSIEEMKEKIYSILNKNVLYTPLSMMNDNKFEITEKEKTFTKEFYTGVKYE